MTTDALDALFATRNRLTQMVIRFQPKTVDQEQDMRQLVELRDKVCLAINRAVEKGFTASAADVATAVGDLNELNDQLDAVKDRIESLKTGLAVTAKIVTVAAQIVGFIV